MELRIAFSTILIIVLILFPGMVFRRFYYQKNFLKQFKSGLFNDRLISNTFWGIVIQIFTLLFFFYTTSESYSEVQDYIKTIVFNSPENLSARNRFQMNIESSTLWGLLLYISVSLAIAGLLGWVFHRTIRIFSLDHRFPVLKYSNNWHYLLRGEDFIRKSKNKNEEYFNTKVNALVTINEKLEVLYTGTLEDYSSNPQGDLEYLTLTEVKYNKSIFGKEFIKDDYLVLPAEKISNFNLRFQLNQKTPKKWRSWFSSIIILLIFIAIIILPWFYFKVGVIRMILGICISLFAFLNLTIFLSSETPIPTEITKGDNETTTNAKNEYIPAQQKWSLKERFLYFFIFLISTLLTLKLFGIL